MKEIYSKNLAKSYIVTVATDELSLLNIFDENLELIYTRTFAADIFIVDFGLINSLSVLVLICEDCTTNEREIMVVDYIGGEYI
jgi:hypothetical protein